MTIIEIRIESDNPALIDKVRAGLQDWNDRLALDVDGNGTHYDCSLYATSDHPDEDKGVVFGSEFDGAENNRASVDDLERAYRKSFDQTTGSISMHALRYAKALILAKFPTATTLVLSDSDQGSGYFFTEVRDAAGEILCDDEGEISDDLWAPLSDLREGYLEDNFEDAYEIPLPEIK